LKFVKAGITSTKLKILKAMEIYDILYPSFKGCGAAVSYRPEHLTSPKFL
jgi:hypothetical protein